jgi:hypothetical protein
MADNKTPDIIGIVGPGGSGGTFLDWTLHYLIGDVNIKQVWVDRKNNKLMAKVLNQKIAQNPIKNDGTAHLHKNTHPTEEHIQICMDQFRLINDEHSNIHTMFIVPGPTSFQNGRTYTSNVKDIAEKYPEMKIIHLIFPDKSIEDLVQRMYTKVLITIQKNIDTIRQTVKTESANTNKIINKPNIYPLNIDTMFSNLDSEIRKIFDWLELTINEERYNHWIEVYKQWQLAQNFCTTIEN